MKAAKKPVKKTTTKKTAAPTPMKISTAQEQKWQAEDDVRTLTRAKEIMEDKARMKRAKVMAESQAAEAAKVAAQLKRKAK